MWLWFSFLTPRFTHVSTSKLASTPATQPNGRWIDALFERTSDENWNRVTDRNCFGWYMSTTKDTVILLNSSLFCFFVCSLFLKVYVANWIFSKKHTWCDNLNDCTLSLFLFMYYNICPWRTPPFLYPSPFSVLLPLCTDAYRMKKHAVIIRWYVVLFICYFILLSLHLWYFVVSHHA
jgi:hypothetical protein